MSNIENSDPLPVGVVRGFLETIMTPAFCLDRNGEYLAGNREFRRLFEDPAPGTEAVPPATSRSIQLPAELLTGEAAIRSGAGALSREAEIRTVQGDRRRFSVHSAALVAADGRQAGSLTILVGLATPGADGERTRLIEAAVSQMADGVAITDQENHIVYVNRGFERLTGYSAAEALGENPRVLKSGHQHPWFYRDMWETLNRGDTWRGRIVNRRKDGREYIEDMCITPLFDQGSAVIGYVAHKRDVTATVEAGMRRTAFERELAFGECAGELTPPFREILSRILAFSVPDSGAAPAAADADDRWARIAEEARAGIELARRWSSGYGAGGERSRVSIRGLLDECVDLIRILFPATVSLVTQLDECGGEIAAAPDGFRRMILRLAIRARDSLLGRPGIVALRATSTEDSAGAHPELLLEMADSGPGLDQGELTRVLTPADRKPEGTIPDRGMAAVRQAVESMDGTIDVESESGRGTVVRIRLPLVHRPTGPVAPPHSENRPHPERP